MPPIVKKCESAVFNELLESSTDNEYNMYFDFRALGLSLTEIIVHISKDEHERVTYGFILRMDNTLQQDIAGYSGDSFEILRYLEDEGGRNSLSKRLKEVINIYFDKQEQRACMVQIHTQLQIGDSEDE